MVGEASSRERKRERTKINEAAIWVIGHLGRVRLAGIHCCKIKIYQIDKVRQRQGLEKIKRDKDRNM